MAAALAVAVGCFVGVDCDEEVMNEARRRTVRWWARVARAFNVRKKRYWMIIGARERNVVSISGDFSIRAQVR